MAAGTARKDRDGNTKVSRSWLFQYTSGTKVRNGQVVGRVRQFGLGAYPDVSLKEARDRAAALRRQVRDGIDPVEARQEKRREVMAAHGTVMTFGEAAERCIAAHEVGWKNPKHRAQWRSTLLGIGPNDKPAKPDYCASIRKLPVGSVDTQHILDILQPIWATKTETATRLRGRIEKVLSWAKAAKQRSGENPAMWNGHLQLMLAKPSKLKKGGHHPALPFESMHEFMQELRQREGVGPKGLEFTILTAVRTNETIGATWNEIDLDKKTWTIPPERMKAAQKHEVPLTDTCITLLQSLPREAGSDYVFIGDHPREPLSDNAMASVIDRINEDREKAGLPKWVDPQENNRAIVPHGFRSSFRDWASEITSHPNHVVEMALAHKVKDKVEAAYRRGVLFAKRKKLMADWEAYCSPEPVPVADNVTTLPVKGKAKVTA